MGMQCKMNLVSKVEDDGSVFIEEKGERKNIRPGELVRACGEIEIAMYKASKYRQSNTLTQVWIESKVQINPETVLEALYLVARQVPQLQFCLAKLRGKLWFKRILKLKIDFETSNENEMEVLVKMLDTTYDNWNGPLWKARLIQSPKKTGEMDKFSAIIIFSISHPITDGSTNMMIAQEFVSMMNNLTDGKPFVSSYSPVIGTIDSIAQNASSFGFRFKKTCCKFYSIAYRRCKIGVPMRDCLPTPDIKEVKINVLIDNFSEMETINIAKMCKKQSVTINTFFVTVINFVLLSIMKNKPGPPVTKKIIFVHAVDLRKLYEPQYSTATGCHAAVSEHEFMCSLNDVDNFWTIARNNNTQIKDQVENKKEYLKSIPLTTSAISSCLRINNFLTRHEYRGIMPLDYSASNLGNLIKYFPEPKEDDNVEITYLTRSASHNLFEHLLFLNFHTLRGKLIFSMDYYPHQLKDDVAEQFFSVLFKFVRNMINYNNLNGSPK